jgi:mannose-6-phosphate isomerase-like protein (cupin superfamily)
MPSAPGYVPKYESNDRFSCMITITCRILRMPGPAVRVARTCVHPVATSANPARPAASLAIDARFGRMAASRCAEPMVIRPPGARQFVLSGPFQGMGVDRVGASRAREHAMSVHIQNRDGGEPLGSSVLLEAFDDLMLSEYRLAPGTDPGDPHDHANHIDAFHVTEGEFEFVIDGEPVRAPAGTLVVAPRGEVHAFPVAVGGPARVLNIHAPGGFECSIRTLMQMRAGGEPDAELQRAQDQYPL